MDPSNPDSKLARLFNAGIAAVPKGKRFTHKENKSVRSFYRYCDDMLRVRTLMSMVKDIPAEERARWDRKFLKRSTFRLDELPEAAAEQWKIHLFLDRAMCEWMAMTKSSPSSPVKHKPIPHAKQTAEASTQTDDSDLRDGSWETVLPRKKA